MVMDLPGLRIILVGVYQVVDLLAGMALEEVPAVLLQIPLLLPPIPGLIPGDIVKEMLITVLIPVLCLPNIQ